MRINKCDNVTEFHGIQSHLYTGIMKNSFLCPLQQYEMNLYQCRNDNGMGGERERDINLHLEKKSTPSSFAGISSSAGDQFRS